MLAADQSSDSWQDPATRRRRREEHDAIFELHKASP